MEATPETIADHFFVPRNVGDAREPSFVGRSASLRCGATSRVSLQVGESNNITEAKFKAAGCSVLVASLSKLTELVQNKTTAEAATIGQDEGLLITCFSDLEPDCIACTTLARQTLLNAIRTFSDAARNEWIGDEPLICTCFCVSERTIEDAITRNKLTSIEGVIRTCYAGGGCGSCHSLIQEMLDLG